MKSLLFLFSLILHITAFADELLYKWTGPNDEFCTAITNDGKTSQVDRKQCILKAPIQYMWIDETHQKCGVYTYKNIFIAATEASNCESTAISASNCAPIIDTTDTELRALIDGMLYKVIPEVLTLKSGEAIPEKIIKEKDSRLIAASIIARLSKSEEVKQDPKESEEDVYDFYHDSEIQMAFNDKNFESIRKGCFRNQFQTNSTNGADAREHRQVTEKTLADINIAGNKDVLENPSDESHHIRPKYAYFVPTKPMQTVMGHQYIESYGNVYAVMKDEIKDRSTFTAQDSLGLGVEGTVLNKKANYKDIRKSKMGYWETQIWGDVCFKDVSHFIVNCPSNSYGAAYGLTSNTINSVSEAALAKMKETGIPVYQCEKEIKGVNTVYTKGAVLVSEDLSKRKVDEAKSDPKSNFPERRKDPAIAQKEAMAAHEAYLKSPEYLKKLEAYIKRKDFLKTPEGKAEMTAKREELRIKKAADLEAFYKTPAGIKAKADEDAFKAKSEEYSKTPEGKAMKEATEKMMAMSEEYFKTAEGVKAKEDMDITSYLFEIGEPDPAIGSYGGFVGGRGYPGMMGFPAAFGTPDTTKVEKKPAE